jgi:hypothetical protein
MLPQSWQAFDEHHSWITIYLPNGTCLVSNTITMTPTCASQTGTGCISGPILQGQSRAGPAGMTFDEYSSAQTSRFPSPTHSMNLPAPAVPDVPWEQDSTKWGNVWANIGGLGGSRKTDSASLQSLIDNPNLTTVCVPAGKLYQINGDIYIRGNIRRLVGTDGNMAGPGASSLQTSLPSRYY